MAKSVLSAPHFQDEAAAFAYVEGKLWPDGPYCPHCGECDRITRLAGKTTRIGLHKCNSCKGQFTVRQGTIFESSHLPLHLWLQVIHLMCASKKGVSTRQVQRMLQCSMKTAWFLTHRIREAMSDDGSTLIGGGGMTIEIDETFLGGAKNTFVSGQGWTADSSKKVVTMVERGGRARSTPVDYVRIPDVARAIESADRDSILNTDEGAWYRRLGTDFIRHDTVKHGAHEYVRGDAHVNTVEGYFSIFKRGMRGIYQHCSEKHLHRYTAEFDFRYSHRSAVGVEDVQRAVRALEGVRGKRLTYQTVSERKPGAEGRIVW